MHDFGLHQPSQAVFRLFEGLAPTIAMVADPYGHPPAHGLQDARLKVGGHTIRFGATSRTKFGMPHRDIS